MRTVVVDISKDGKTDVGNRGGLSSCLRDTGFNPGQRDAIVSLTAAAIGFLCAFPIIEPFHSSTLLDRWWSQTCLVWDRRAGAGCAQTNLSRYPVTCSLSESCGGRRVRSVGQSSLVLVCFWCCDTQTRSRRARNCFDVSCRVVNGHDARYVCRDRNRAE
jgi:hypothetical protein